MSKNEFIKQALELIYATDDEGFPLQAHTKIARLQILADKYKQEAKK